MNHQNVLKHLIRPKIQMHVPNPKNFIKMSQNIQVAHNYPKTVPNDPKTIPNDPKPSEMTQNHPK